ncbi:HIRAN domain-containing protein [Agromyces kandeliae]|uniref:HIRAN domain-containing protein n=1 Tax=Agromyces kandeliae TaxID=2666141 RepID=A0A6L5QXJ1_9MICO|nr:HIRAN domain-containing protein [Agromyces kandeliae]MRX42343.1 hypothetical protein [Agromyces kandeliae]
MTPRDEAQSRYLPSSRWDELLSPAVDPPRLRLVPYRGEWWLEETTTGQLVKVANRHLAALGIWTCAVRGVKYYGDAAKVASLSPGTPVQLVREPNNPHDANAIAVVADGLPVGHVNKQMAARMAHLLDAGDPLRAISVAGSAAGVEPDRVHVLAASPALLSHLLGERPTRAAESRGWFARLRACHLPSGDR